MKCIVLKNNFFKRYTTIVTFNRRHVLIHVSQNFKETNLPKKKKKKNQSYGFKTGWLCLQGWGLDQQQKITFKITNYYGTTLIKQKYY